MSTAQLTPLFGNDVLSRVERMRLFPRRKLTDRRRGEHLFGKGGSSTEFSDFRDYVPGDDVRYVDWNIFLRLNRPFVKLFHHEEQMHIVLVVDASASMAFENKLLRAQQLTAALGVMGLFSLEPVSVHVINDAGRASPRLSPCTGRASLGKLLSFAQQIEPGGAAPVEDGITAMLNHHRGRGIAIILSDFLTFGDVRTAFNRLNSAGLETFAIQILGPTEIDPELAGDLRLEDSETGATLDVSGAAQLLSLYHEHRAAFARQLDELCQQRGGRFLATRSDEPLNTLLFDTLRRKGWVRG
jgi:uncharacterized protein (DUF58 family)